MSDDRNLEAKLLRQAANGNDRAFCTIFERHHREMFRCCYRLTNSHSAADDITQECFLQLVMHPERFDPRRGSLRQYMYGIVRNLSRQLWQTAGREVLWEDVVSDETETCISFDSMEFQELSRAVQAAVAKLPPLQREALVLVSFEELSLRESAEIVGTDLGTLKSRLFRARGALRRMLRPYAKHAVSPAKKEIANESFD